MKSRGIRNCNPLNIRIGNDWVGERQENTDGVFEQFTDMRFGIRAAFIILRNYITKYRIKTVQGIIQRWAPEVENDLKAYVTSVTRRTEKEPHDTIEWGNSHDMAMLVQAMCIFESNYRPELTFLEQIHRETMNTRRVQK